MTNKNILKKNYKLFISFLNQFIAISKEECVYFVNNYIKIENLEKVPAVKIADLIIKSIFITHKDYNGSMFSEYELIGQSNYILSQEVKTASFLRFGLDGKLTKTPQKKISILFGYKHVTYEHSHPNVKSEGMLSRNQSWLGF